MSSPKERLPRVKALLDDAESAMRSGRYAESSDKLDQAYSMLEEIHSDLDTELSEIEDEDSDTYATLDQLMSEVTDVLTEVEQIQFDPKSEQLEPGASALADDINSAATSLRRLY